jgi:hypothetical protein
LPPGSLHPAWPLLLLLGSGFLAAQDDPGVALPPDFSQEPIQTCAGGVLDAWKKWTANSKGLEERAFSLPMAEARELAGRALGDYLEFLERRNAYGQAVAAYIERPRAAHGPSGAVVSEAGISQDQILLLAASLGALQTKLHALRDTADWVRIRRAVQPDRDAILKLQAALRAQAEPQDLAIGSSPTLAWMASVAYRESERQLAEILRRLWTHYYQALVDGLEQRPAGSTPLGAIRASDSPAPKTAAATGGRTEQNPLVGAWEYVEGSQEFNGVAEPRHALLELWIEKGVLVGRYRADLPDFSGERKIDLRLSARTGASHSTVILDFRSADPQSQGEIVLEGPLEGATKLMLVRNVPAQGPIPRGRELLRRR